MKLVNLLHNPKAGAKSHSKKRLIELIESKGYRCIYSSVKKTGWDKISDDFDIIAIAGGDGTVRKVVSALLHSNHGRQIPLALLPLGTANNIAKSLNIPRNINDAIDLWNGGNYKSFDIGTITGLTKKSFLMESAGFGIFPALISEMSTRNDISDDPEESLKIATKTFLEIAAGYEPRECKLFIDGEDHSGKYLLVEVMNTNFLGPNLNVNVHADPGDGLLEVFKISASQRDELCHYMHNKLNDREIPDKFSLVHAKSISIQWDGRHIHIDDEVKKIRKQTSVGLCVEATTLRFIVAGN
jgi:diacylglycerol kinase family enzyme